MRTKNRIVICLDGGWIFGLDVASEESGRIRGERVVNVRHWQEIGFEGVLADPFDRRVKLFAWPKDIPADIPYGAELFRALVADDWGIR